MPVEPRGCDEAYHPPAEKPLRVRRAEIWGFLRVWRRYNVTCYREHDSRTDSPILDPN